MTLIKTMNADGTLGHKTGSAVSGGSFTITSTPSSTTEISGKGVYVSPLEFTFTGGNATGFVNGSVQTAVPQKITSGATNVQVDGADTMNEGDFATVAMIGTISPPATPPTGPVTPAIVEVATAGQDKMEND